MQVQKQLVVSYCDIVIVLFHKPNIGGGASLEIFSMPYCIRNCVLIHIGLHVHVIYSVLQSDNGLKIFFGWFELCEK